MRNRHPIIAAILAVSLLATVAGAEPLGRHFELTPFGGWTVFDGRVRVITGQPLTDDLYFGGRLNYTMSRRWALEVASGVTPTQEDVPSGRDVDFFHVSGNVLFTPFANRHGGPFLFAGGGSQRVSVSGGPRTNGGDLEYGGGVRFWMSDGVGLRAELRGLYAKADATGGGSENLDHLIAGAGLTFALGATPRDTDGDGVPDRKDTCPNTPHGARVDANGCPLDADGDKVFDGLDQCPDTKAGCTVDAKGCPGDADGDGVCDGVDQCAETPKGAGVDGKGCPVDGDHDGVFDGLDQCPGTPAGAGVDGKGCPVDSDHDGVFDGLDQCPETPAGLKVDGKGCPIELMERETELLDTGMIRLNNINFESGQAVLLPEDLPTLDTVGALLVKWPQLQIEIGGHTDNSGSAATNRKLSGARAAAVKAYLVEKNPGLAPGQYTTKGYGSSKPVASNQTVAGKAQNRRVEFQVQNKDVLKREIERRRMMPAAGAPADTTKH